MPANTWRPTNKWIAALVSGLGTIATMALTTGTWDTEESVALVGLLVERIVSYLTPNQPPIIDGSDQAGQTLLELVIVLFVLVLIVLLLTGRL